MDHLCVPESKIEEFYAAFNSSTFKYKFMGEQRGKGLVAKRAIEQGQVVFIEKPFGYMQHVENEEYVTGCGHCGQGVQSIQKQLQQLIDAGYDDDDKDYCKKYGHLKRVQAFDWDAECSEQCMHCQVKYCSAKCKELAWTEYHCLLCPAEGIARQEWSQHVANTNDAFYLAGKILARMVLRVADGMHLRDAIWPFPIHHAVLWWKVASRNEKDPIASEQLLRDLASHTARQLRSTIAEGANDVGISPEMMDQCESLFKPEFLATILGAFEMNNLAVELPHPLSNIAQLPRYQQDALAPYVDMIHNTYSTEQEMHGSDQCADVPCSTITPKDFGKVRFPTLEGTGLYTLVATMNHACDPNCVATFSKGTNTVEVIALRDIAQEEELCISYIDVDMPHDDRQMELSDYYFSCTCGRCIREQADPVEN